ncbi:MAG: TonB-dependent receptor, partial [Bacteroidia bacterium]|nr:TonB-dependent receptor [Bacteroidia bacterium]
FLDHARNDLDAFVYNVQFKGTKLYPKQKLDWGLRYQYEEINDELSEWDLTDSSGFAVPQLPIDQIVLQEVIKSNNSITSSRVMGYLQSTFNLGKEKRTSVSAGARFNYWDFSEQLVVSPRVVMQIPSKNNERLRYKIAAGVYHQPPFYRELRDFDGQLNPNIKAQRSIHFVVGNEYEFLSFGREFKLNTEIYYKQLDNLVPYKIDNLRIRYLGDNNATGYATGIDARINGEFVPGVQSWASLSILKTQEDIDDDFYYDADSNLVKPGFLDRPTDQRVTFSLFFQDYLPKNPSLKMNLTLVFGTGLPFGPPGPDRYQDVFNFPWYRRVDIGLIKEIKPEDSEREYRFKVLNRLNSMSLSLEVFNLLQVNNVVSYLWITDVTSNRFAVPNFLTARQVNLRLSTTF